MGASSNAQPSCSAMGLGKQAVHRQRASVLQHYVGHAVYARDQSGFYLRATAGDGGQLFGVGRVGAVQKELGAAPALASAAISAGARPF